MTKNKVFENLKLTKEEQKIEKALENNEYVKVSDFAANKRMFQEAAKNFRQLRKSKRITIRVNQEDLIKVKAKALRSKIPYQTLLNALIHQYAKGQNQVKL